MNIYKHPTEDSRFLLEHVFNSDKLAETLGIEELSLEWQGPIIDEAAKFCESVIAPINREGDQYGATLTEGEVTAAPGFAEAYQQFVANGWPSLVADPTYGGQGLPKVLGVAVEEMIQASNLAFALNPLLTSGAVDAIHSHASESLKAIYLPKMISGEWAGTMNLTEPDAGSDLAAVKSRAIPEGDHYRISGQKIFITWGEHSLTENIVHLVLARLPDAPAGVKGISLFVVPKFLVNDDGSLGERNDVRCVSLEHKLGIHASPTCVMSYGEQDGAIGYLVGQPNQGLACMFTMMNNARQGVGLQGLAISERAYQQARQYAKDRLQGTRSDGSRFNIMAFADVRRQLMMMRSGTEAMRALAYVAGLEADKKSVAEGTDAANHMARIELYTPIVKAWLTEFAQELTGLGVQIHGGMGFIEETGAAQHYRDARILTIYEGTTAIQGNDLIGRKLLANGGKVLGDLLAEINADADAVVWDELADARAAVLQAALDVENCLHWILENAKDPQVANAIGSNMLMALGFLCGGWMMLKSAQCANDAVDGGGVSAAFVSAKATSCKFFCNHFLPRVASYTEIVKCGKADLFDIEEDSF